MTFGREKAAPSAVTPRAAKRNQPSPKTKPFRPLFYMAGKGIASVIFPVTVEAFIDDQARRADMASGELPSDLCECLSVWVPLFNAAFEDGKRKDVKALLEMLKFLDGHRSQEDSAFLSHWIDASRRWIITAWQQGAVVR